VWDQGILYSRYAPGFPIILAAWIALFGDPAAHLLNPIIFLVLVLATVNGFLMLDLIYVLTRGGPGGATETLALLTYQTLFQDLDFGRGSALAVVMFAANFGLSLLLLRLLLRP